MTAGPETHYTRSADGTNLAYQVSGEGPLGLVFVPSPAPVDLLSDDPGCVRIRKRLGLFSRTVWWDARARGASEGDQRDSLTAEIFDTDLTAVLDTVGLERPAMVGTGESGALAIRFSVTHPDRVGPLVLINSFAHYVQEDDYPWGVPPESLDTVLSTVQERWGTAAAVEMIAPSRIADERFRAWYSRLMRFTGGPDQLGDTVLASFNYDVRSLLPSISVPTLVLHREGNRFIRLGAGRYLAEHIPSAKFVVLPGDDHLFFVGDTDAVVDEIEEFLTGIRSGAEGDVRTMTV